MTEPTKSVADLARILGASEAWVADQTRRGRFPHLRVAKHRRFTDAHIEAILALLEEKPEPATPVGLTPRSRAAHRRRRQAS